MKHRINILVFALNLTWISLFFQNSRYYFWLLGGAIVLFLVIMSLGVLFMQFNYFLKATTKLSSDKVLLTFDDGPDPTHTPIVLDTLKAHGIGAVFFVIGMKAKRHPDLIQRIIDEGHMIGNHSFEHNNFMSLFPKQKLRADLSTAQQLLKKLTGKQPLYFRPPIGYTNPNYARVLQEMNLKTIGWSIRSYDSVYNDPEKLQERLLKLVKPGDIILLHDNLPVAANALDDFITKARANGIIFASNTEVNNVLHD